MAEFEISQKLLSIGATYQVFKAGDSEPAYTVKGKLLTLTPKLTMVEGSDGPVVAQMTGNLFKTTFTMTDNQGGVQAVLTFPFFVFLKKSFNLECGGQSYPAAGGFTGRSFECGAFTVDKKLAFKDKFQLSVVEDFPPDVAILACVAIDQKFFEGDD